MYLKADTHIHTIASDGNITANDVILMALRKKIGLLAITDHNVYPSHTLTDHLEKKLSGKCIVLLGVEVSTSIGHILIIGIDDRDPRLLRFDNPMELIKYAEEKNYNVTAPHPFDYARKGIGKHLQRLKIRIIEGINGRTPAILNYLTLKFSRRHSLLAIAGSDAHIPNEIGRTYFLIEQAEDKEEAIDKIKRGRILLPLESHLAPTWDIEILLNRITSFMLKRTARWKILHNVETTRWMLVGRIHSETPLTPISKLYNACRHLASPTSLLYIQSSVIIHQNKTPLVRIDILPPQNNDKSLILADIYANRELPKNILRPLHNISKILTWQSYTKKDTPQILK